MAMKAIYNGQLYTLVEFEDVTVTMEDDNGHRFDALLSDIIADPTDDEIWNILPDYFDDLKK
jgi:hypothetical protein